MKRKILLGLTGSVATVLYEKLITQLQKIGDVDVILTESARHFVNENQIRSLVGNLNLWTDEHEWTWDDEMGGLSHFWKKDKSILHIQLRDRASALVIAPCSANTMAKLANGFCDNLLTTVARAWNTQRPLIVAPAMNTAMWDHLITEDHLSSLRRFGYKTISPQKKRLACGTYGVGAMADIDVIVNELYHLLRWHFPLDMMDCSGIPIGNHPGAFSTQRKFEKHTGVDLYTNNGQRVLAVEAGTVVNIEHFTGEWDNSPWWNNTDCVMIEGATGVVCYGEIDPSPYLVVGSKVTRGQLIGFVTPVLKDAKRREDIPGHNTSMLHMELYPHGTTKASNGFEEHLQDPTPYLLDCWDGHKLKQLTYGKTD